MGIRQAAAVRRGAVCGIGEGSGTAAVRVQRAEPLQHFMGIRDARPVRQEAVCGIGSGGGSVHGGLEY